MTEHRGRGEYIPNILNAENVAERTATFLATARTTDQVRATIASGKYDHLSSKKVYLLIHKTHVHGNPEHVYDQEHTPQMNTQPGRIRSTSTLDYLQAGKFRTVPVSGGTFNCLVPSEVQRIGNRFFKEIDALLDQLDFLSSLEIDLRLAILVLLDQMCKLCHFVKNASGRTDEDFLHYLAARLKIPFTISSSGFRGQMSHDPLEDEIEANLWIFRNASAQDVPEAAHQILLTVQSLSGAVQAHDVDSVAALLATHETEDLCVAPLVEKFREATTKMYHPLPRDLRLQEQIAKAAAHFALQERQVYDPTAFLAPQVKAYIEWHIHEMTQIAYQLSSEHEGYFSMLIKQKIQEAQLKMSTTEGAFGITPTIPQNSSRS